MATKTPHDTPLEPHSDPHPPDMKETEFDITNAGLAAAAGAVAGGALGALGGPVTAIAGATLGAIAGGIASEAAEEAINLPKTDSPAESEPPRTISDDGYWRLHYRDRPYVGADEDYELYQPAFRYGWEARTRHPDRPFEDLEAELEKGWSEARGSSSMEWGQARHATRDAWYRREPANPLDLDFSGH